MQNFKKILLIGAGAIGSVYASCLCKSNNDFAIAADSARIAKYKRDGIFFCGQRINAPFITPDKNYGTADIILIAVKNYSLSEALEIIAPAVGKDTVIIPLLNGITSEEKTAKRFSKENVLYGYYIGHTSTREGNMTNQDGNYVTIIGDYPSTDQPFSTKLTDTIRVLSTSGIKVEGRKDMKTEIWKKFVVNVCLNQTTAFYNCTYGEILASNDKKTFFKKIALEVEDIALKEKIYGAETFSEYAFEILLKMNPNDRSSMAQDVKFGRRTEVDDFAGEVIRLGKKYGIRFHANETVLNHFLKK